jgi:hypothetical protein
MDLVQRLKLKQTGEVQVYTADGGEHTCRVFGIVDLSVQGRSCQVRAIELPHDAEPLLGAVPLEEMDWHVSAQQKKLVPNPKSPEKPLLPLCGWLAASRRGPHRGSGYDEVRRSEMRVAMLLPAAAVAAVLAAGCGPSGSSSRPGAVAGSAAGTADLERRVAALDARLDRVEQRGAPVVAAAGSADPGARGAAGTLDERLRRIERTLQSLNDSLDARIDSRIDGRIGTEGDIQAIFEEAVTQQLARAETRKAEEGRRQAEEWRARWAERQAEQERKRMDQLVKDLSLSDWKRQQLEAALAKSREGRDAVAVEVRGGGAFNWTAFRGRIEEVQKERRKALAVFLTPEQVEAVEASPLVRNQDNSAVFSVTSGSSTSQDVRASVSIQIGEP